MNKLEILSSFLGKYNKSRDEYLFYCPKCKHHKRKLSINLEKNVFKCWKCEYSGISITTLIKWFAPNKLHLWQGYDNVIDLAEYIDFDGKLKFDDEETIELELPKDFISLVGNHDMIANSIRKYLYSRNVTEDKINVYKIGYAIRGPFKQNIIFPSFDKTGNLNYYVGKNKKYYTNAPIPKFKIIFNELYINWNKPVILCEGIFDALNIGQNAIPILGSTLSKKSLLFKRLIEHQVTVVLALDKDAEKKEKRISSMLLDHGLMVKKMIVEPYKDVGEMKNPEVKNRLSNLISLNDFKNNINWQLKNI